MKIFGSIALEIAAFLFGIVGLAHAADAGGASPARVMFVILENADYSDALAQPFLASLAARGALLTNVTAVAHPSLPNYIALISGSTQGVTTDRPVTLAAAHIGDLLELKGLRWKVYAEGYPGDCFLGDRLGNYARRHVPFLSFENVQNDPKRCASIVDGSQLDIDVHSAGIPDFSIYVPDMRNDGHDTGVAFADNWLARRFSSLLDDPQFMKNMLLIITFDEGEGPTNHVATIIFGDQVAAGAKSNAPLTHYDLLRLAERTLGLGIVAQGDRDARQVEGIWRQ